MPASCLSAAVPLSPNLGSSEEELYPSACSEPGSVPSSALGRWPSRCPSCCLSFPFHLQVVFPAFKCKLLRAGTVSRTGTSRCNSIAPLSPRGGSPSDQYAPWLGGCSARGFGMCLGRKGWMSREDNGKERRGEIWPRAAEDPILGGFRMLSFF